MANPTSFHYRDSNRIRHRLLVRQTRDGAWEIIDVTARLIDTLTGVDEGRETAEAIARDYAAQHHHPTPAARTAAPTARAA